MCARLPAALRVDAHGVSLLVEHGELLGACLGIVYSDSAYIFKLVSGNLCVRPALSELLHVQVTRKGVCGAAVQRVGKWAGWLAGW